MARRKRNGHQPGRNNDTHEGRQQREVARLAGVSYVNSDKKYGPKVARNHMSNSIYSNERKTSISSSKLRERYRGR